MANQSPESYAKPARPWDRWQHKTGPGFPLPQLHTLGNTLGPCHSERPVNYQKLLVALRAVVDSKEYALSFPVRHACCARSRGGKTCVEARRL